MSAPHERVPREVPVLLQLPGGFVLVIGGGPVGLRKARFFLRCGIRVHLVDPHRPHRLPRGITFLRRKVTVRNLSSFLRGAAVVVAATNDPDLNAKVAQRCRRQSVLVNVVTHPHLGTITIPATLHHRSLTIAISTRGRAPGYARTLRRRLQPNMHRWSQELETYARFPRRR